MIWAAARIEATSSLPMSFSHLALLNFGQAQVFLWWWQVNHVLAPVVAGAITIVLLVRGNKLQLREAILIGRWSHSSRSLRARRAALCRGSLGMAGGLGRHALALL